MYLTIVILPFLGSILVGIRGRTIGFVGSGIITTCSIVISACLSWIATYEVILANSGVEINVFNWVSIGSETLEFTWKFNYDQLTIVICTVVLTVSAIVHIFSLDYMANDPHGIRFICLLSLFTAFIIMLVTGGNLAIIFVGWEGIGVSSFLLIGFWFTRIQAVKSAVKAITINRVGDIFLTFGIFVTFVVFGSLDYTTVFASTPLSTSSSATPILVIASILILVGAIAKSAQVPLHTWLAAAMEGKEKGIIEAITTSIFWLGSVTLKLVGIMGLGFLDVFTGCILGDGHVGSSGGGGNGQGGLRGNARYSISMKTSSLGYMIFLMTTYFGPYLTLNFRPVPFPNPITNPGVSPSHYWVGTVSSFLFTLLHQIWYRWNGVSFIKVVPLMFVRAFLGWSGLIHWIVQDGPTPVSALIHAATLVTAGVYLILRITPILEYATTTLIAIAFIGAITTIFAATSGIVQNDIKRVIAYSTCSQMGYLFISLGLGQYNLALYHLANHACFKALLFIAAGAVIHAFMDQQDIRRYGGLVNVLPFVYSAILLGSLSLIAIPYITGWYSKDGILEMAVGSFTVSGSVVYVIGTLVAGITAFYSIRLLYLTFLTEPNSNNTNYVSAHESNNYVIVPLVFLSIFAIGLGYLTSDLYRGIGSDFLSIVASTSPSQVTSVDAEFGIITIYKLIPLVFTVIGTVIAYWIYITSNGQDTLNRYISNKNNLYRFFNNQWNFDSWVINIAILGSLSLGHNISKIMDRGIIESLGPYGLQQGFTQTGISLSIYNTGILTDYAIFIVLGILSLIMIIYTIKGEFVSITNIPILSILIIVNTFSAYIIIRK